MKLFQGLNRSDYQDVLRALGFFIDEQGYTDVRILENEEGLIFQGRRVHPDTKSVASSFDTFLITENEIREMVRDSYKRRHTPAY